jgi:tRNA nucleotidyltransferase (CCA-adding enzyme)
VERSTLRHDLGRRDFTINAMASSLKADDLGATYDFSGGYRDLRRGTVRVLHNLSFVEDPTRLLRAVRYEARLGFRMDAHTLSLAKGCIDMRLVGDLSSARLRDELLVILEEPQIGAALARMAELGLDRALHPHLDAGPRAVRLIESAARVMTSAPFSAARPTLVRLAAMCMAMPAHELYGWMERLKLRRRDQDVVAAAVTLAPAIAQRLSGAAAAAPSEMHELLAGQALEVLVLAAASVDSPEVEERLRNYLERVRDVRLEISGDDLRRAGVPESPAIGEALRRTLALKLDGFVSGRDEELRTALRLLGRQ